METLYFHFIFSDATVRIDRYTAAEHEMEFTIASPGGRITNTIVSNFFTELRNYCPAYAPKCVPKLAAGDEKQESRP